MKLFLTIHQTPARRSTPARAICALAWLMVAFYVVASGRALLPGLCATQAAMDAQRGLEAVVATGAGCCPVPVQPEDDCHDSAPRPVTPQESSCAFCNLVIALSEPTPALAIESPAAPRFAERLALSFQIPREIAEGAAPNRAPPA